jgi:hypothetical protein
MHDVYTQQIGRGEGWQIIWNKGADGAYICDNAKHFII